MNFTEMILILCAMLAGITFRRLLLNRSKGQDKAQARRLARIQNASVWIQVLMVVSCLAGIYAVLAFMLGWPYFTGGRMHVVISPGHSYASPADMPAAMLVWWLIKMAWSLFCYGAVFLLFRLYYKGIYFSVQNVRLIRALGIYLAGSFCIDSMIQGQIHDMNVSMTPFFVGMGLTFISWIMDEGRKMQEEQELTV